MYKSDALTLYFFVYILNFRSCMIFYFITSVYVFLLKCYYFIILRVTLLLFYSQSSLILCNRLNKIAQCLQPWLRTRPRAALEKAFNIWPGAANLGPSFTEFLSGAPLCIVFDRYIILNLIVTVFIIK